MCISRHARQLVQCCSSLVCPTPSHADCFPLPTALLMTAQVVEAVLDALEGKLSPNAVNAPMVPAEVSQGDSLA